MLAKKRAEWKNFVHALCNTWRLQNAYSVYMMMMMMTELEKYVANIPLLNSFKKPTATL